MIHEAAPERPLTFSFLVLFGILAVVQGSPSRKLRDVLPGTQTLSLGLSQLPAPVPGPARPIRLAAGAHSCLATRGGIFVIGCLRV